MAQAPCHDSEPSSPFAISQSRLRDDNASTDCNLARSTSGGRWCWGIDLEPDYSRTANFHRCFPLRHPDWIDRSLKALACCSIRGPSPSCTSDRQGQHVSDSLADTRIWNPSYIKSFWSQ